MDRFQLQRNQSPLLTVCSTQDTLSCNTQVTPLDVCRRHSNSSLVMFLEFPTAHATEHTLTRKLRWFRKTSCAFGTEKNVGGRKGVRGRLNCGFHCKLWVTSTREEQRGKKKRLFWDGCYSDIISKGAHICRAVSIAMPCVCMDKYHMPQSSLLRVVTEFVLFLMMPTLLFWQCNLNSHLVSWHQTHPHRSNTLNRSSPATATALRSLTNAIGGNLSPDILGRLDN